MIRKNITIFKTGRFETFVEDSGDEISLGDVVRTTAILRGLKAHQKINWITSAQSLLFLRRFPQVIPYFYEKTQDLKSFFLTDTIFVNLEKYPETISLLKEHQDKVIGFVPTERGWEIKDRFGRLYKIDDWKNRFQVEQTKSWNEQLFLLLGLQSSNTLPLIERSSVAVLYDIGFNWKAGLKWPSKEIDIAKWSELEKRLCDRYTISWQQGFDSVSEYMNWISSNRVLISIDSLGLHLAMGMDIPVIGLFGPTHSKLVDSNQQSRLFSLLDSATSRHCGPCYLQKCSEERHCSEFFPFKKIENEIDRLLAYKGFSTVNL